MSRNNKTAMNSQRDRATVKRLLIEKAPKKRIRPESTMRQAKVAPNRQWFGNTRVIGQKELSQFREEIENKVSDPYTVVLKGKKLPMSLLTDATKTKPGKKLPMSILTDATKTKPRKGEKLPMSILTDATKTKPVP
ncbi:NUC091 domain-containing protein [Baffinella frigidus]|nr:NUC091 domain-containing protein [Cryptophyta sp. CCMP2293]